MKIAAALLLLAAQCAAAAEPTDVSLLQLIATPQQYHGDLVRVVGYLHIEFEGNGLYVHQEDFEKSLYKNGIWINVEGPTFKAATAHSNSFVLMEGIFDAKDKGHLGLWSGALSNISRIDSWGTK